MKIIETLKNDLFRPDEKETTGQVVFYRLFELFVVYSVVEYVWTWGFYIPNLGEVLLPLGIANYVDISFMFNSVMAIGNAAIITLLLIQGFFRSNKYVYFIAIILFHFQYAARFSQGEISHGSNMIGTALFTIAIAHLLFNGAEQRRKFSFGTLIFFIGLGYFTAAMSKLIGTGPSWMDGSHLWLWIGERSTDVLSQTGSFEFNFLQEYILQYHWLATMILAFGFFSELFGFLFWFRKTRPFAALYLIAMHFGILVTMNINFPKYVYVMIFLGFNWHVIIDYLIDKYKETAPARLIVKNFSPNPEY